MTDYIFGAVTVTVFLGLLFWWKGIRENRRHRNEVRSISQKLLRARTSLHNVQNGKNMNDAIRISNQGLEASK